jgi:hypothetical protein
MTIPPGASRPGPAPLRRRAAAGLAAALLAVAATVFGGAGPAAAHAGVVLTLHGDGRGSVWLTAVWEDGHPVTEPVGVTMLATSSTGQRVGPAPLKRNGDALTYAGTLAPGEWTVVADMGAPAIGRCQGVVRVAAAGATPVPDKTTCAPPSAAAAPAPAPSPAKSSFAWVWWLAGAVVVVAVLITVFRRKLS